LVCMYAIYTPTMMGDWCCHLYSSCSSAMQRWVKVLLYFRSVYKISHSCVEVLIFTSFHLESCILPDVICEGSDSESASNWVQISEKV
jgi:hypothetical protein